MLMLVLFISFAVSATAKTTTEQQRDADVESLMRDLSVLVLPYIFLLAATVGGLLLPRKKERNFKSFILPSFLAIGMVTGFMVTTTLFHSSIAALLFFVVMIPGLLTFTESFDFSLANLGIGIGWFVGVAISTGAIFPLVGCLLLAGFAMVISDNCISWPKTEWNIN